MSRRRRADKREVTPDPIYRSETLTRFIHRVMKGGKKSIAQAIVYDALKKLAQRVGADNPLHAFEQALDNVKPALEVKTRRVGGANYQVPVEIPSERRQSLAMKWIINYSRAKPGKPMTEALAQELADAFNSQGTSVKKKEDMHRMAEANKAFAHFKW